MRLLPLQKLIALAFFVGISGLTIAQVANDRCINAASMELAINEANCTPTAGDTRGTENATDPNVVMAPTVCSGSWYQDDVWFSFSTGATVPEDGVMVMANFDPIANPSDVPSVGMAIYDGCSVDDLALECFSSEDPEENSILLPPQCLDANTIYLVRVWSGGDPVANAGTFTICSFAAEPQPTIDETVIWEEDFDGGIGDWTTEGVSDSTHLWLWNEEGSFANAFGGTVGLNSFTASCNGAMGFPAGWIQTGRTGDPMTIGAAPYPQLTSSLISPSIDLSNFPCASVRFTESFRGLNGSGVTNLGAFLDYSIDGGETWIGGTDVGSEPESEIQIAYNGRERTFPLVGVANQSDVRLRFTFDGDFYYWILDDVKIVEREDNNMRAQANFFATAPTSHMSINQIDDMGFLMDIINLGCMDQTDVNVNCTCLNGAGEEVFTTDLAYGTIGPDSLAENQLIPGRFTPPATVDTYTCTYTVSSAEMDEDPTDNTQSFSFSTVDEAQFRKDDGRTRGLIPNTDDGVFWEAGEVHSWEIGNAFYATKSEGDNGDTYKLNQIDFQVDNPDVLVGENIRVWLYKFTDNDLNGVIDKSDASEITRLGLGEYTFTGFEDAAALISVNVEAFISEDDLIVTEGTHYFASVEFPTQTVDLDMQIAASEATNYAAQMYIAQNILAMNSGDVMDARYSHGMGIGKEGTLRFTNTGDITTTNFGDDIVPVVRLGYEVIPAMGNSSNDLSDDIAVSVFPNPASTEITLDLNITESVDKMNIQIVSISGKSMLSQDYNSTKELKKTFDISSYAAGVYFVHINTEIGMQTQKFVISK